MAAPTPVSAYLHAASMVKAGIYLVALLAPGVRRRARLAPDRCSSLGVATMLARRLAGPAPDRPQAAAGLRHGQPARLPAGRARRHRHPHGGAGRRWRCCWPTPCSRPPCSSSSASSTTPTGTRDLRELSGVGRRLPGRSRSPRSLAARVDGRPAAAARLRRQGDAVRRAARARPRRGPGVAGLVGVAGPGRRWSSARCSPSPTPPASSGAPSPPSPASPRPRSGRSRAAVRGRPRSCWRRSTVGLAFAGGALTTAAGAVRRPAPGRRPRRAPRALARLRAAAAALRRHPGRRRSRSSAFRDGLCRFQARFALPVTAERAYRWGIRAVDRVGHRGDRHLPARLASRSTSAVILVVVLAAPGCGAGRAAGRRRRRRLDVVLWDSAGQHVVAAGDGGRRGLHGALAPAAAGRRPGRGHRLRAARCCSCCTGAPDLALTQVLVETVSLVVVRAGAAAAARLLHRPAAAADPLRPDGARRRRSASRWPGSCWSPAAPARPTPISETFAEMAYLEFGYGRNVVNVTLVDIRAWDTFGEISVLVAAATGVASLIFLDTRASGIRRVYDVPYPAGVEKQPTGPGRRVWLPGPRTLQPRPPLDRLRGGHPAALPHDHRLLALPAVRRAQPARRRLRRPAWSPASPSSCATSPAAGTSSTRPPRSTPAC